MEPVWIFDDWYRYQSKKDRVDRTGTGPVPSLNITVDRCERDSLHMTIYNIVRLFDNFVSKNPCGNYKH